MVKKIPIGLSTETSLHLFSYSNPREAHVHDSDPARFICIYRNQRAHVKIPDINVILRLFCVEKFALGHRYCY